MRIFVVGNINAGKSHVAKKLQRIYPDYPVLSIDQYRKTYADGTVEKELSTRAVFARDIIQRKDAIIEFSGGSNITDLFTNQLRPNSVIVLEINADVSDCLSRLKHKDFSKIPYPKYSESIEDTIIRLDGLFKSHMIESNFGKVIFKHFKITSHYDLTDLPLKQYENAIRVSDIFENMPVSLFSFGSLTNDSLNANSDVDLFMRTDLPIQTIKGNLTSHYQNAEFIIQKDRIAIYDQDDLIEINVIRSLNEAQLFYCNSEIKSIHKTILLDEPNLLENLTYIVNTYNYDIYQDICYTLSRLKYYYYSLLRVIRKDDLYKYYFHTNIVMHEYVRLVYFIKGNKAHGYLPKQAIKYAKKEVLQQLMFKIDDDMLTHLSNIKPLVEKIINRTQSYLSSKFNQEKYTMNHIECGQ